MTRVPGRDQFRFDDGEFGPILPSLRISGTSKFSVGSFSTIGFRDNEDCPLMLCYLSGSTHLGGELTPVEIRVNHKRLMIGCRTDDVEKNAEGCNLILDRLGLAGEVHVYANDDRHFRRLEANVTSSSFSRGGRNDHLSVELRADDRGAVIDRVESRVESCFVNDVELYMAGWFERGKAAQWDEWRPRLNKFSSNWTCIPTHLRFSHSPLDDQSGGYTDEEPGRFPVLYSDEKFQVDLVRGATSCVLELQSLSGEKTLKKLEKSVGLTCTRWNGPMHLRWDGRGGITS